MFPELCQPHPFKTRTCTCTHVRVQVKGEPNGRDKMADGVSTDKTRVQSLHGWS